MIDGVTSKIRKVLAVDVETDNGIAGVRYASDVRSLAKLADNEEQTWIVFFSWGFILFIDQIPPANFELKSTTDEQLIIAMAKMHWLNELLEQADSEGCTQLQVDIAYGIKTVPRMELID